MVAHIVMAVTNDLVTDQRVHKIATTLSSEGFDVTVIGRQLPQSQSLLPRTYQSVRLKLLFRRGILFYAEYNLRLFFKLICLRPDIVTANDLDTLPGAWFASALLRKKLVYDSHEYFTQVPELANRSLHRKVWERIEKLLVPRADACMTVCQSIADIYTLQYKKPFSIVRNVPVYSQFPLSENVSPIKTILYQGAVNMGRGLELMIDAMLMVDNAQLLIIGGGDILSALQEKVARMSLSDKVIFVGRLPFEALRSYTLNAHLGISLEENLGLNYYYALPNKLFDYIQCSVPVLSSDLHEMRRIVSQYGVGRILEERTAVALARLANEMLTDTDQRLVWQANAKKAATELCWEHEKQTLVQLYRDILA